VPISEYTPTPEQVATLVRARLTDGGGNEVGTFTDTTRPNSTQVEDLIGDTVRECYPFFGQDIPDSIGEEKDALRKSALRAVMFGVAALVEISYFPEQVGVNRSPYKEYQERYEKMQKSIGKAISDIASGDEPGTDDNSMQALSDGFPEDEGGMVGWNTRW
jgi:hypothetical protein